MKEWTYLEKKEFRKLIKEIGFKSQKSFAQNIGVKATTFTTYKTIPNHIVRIVKLAKLAKDNGIELEKIQKVMELD